MENNHFISFQAAKEMIDRYKEMKDKLICEEYSNQQVLPTCETFDRSALDQLLKKDGCAKIRIYFGLDEVNQVRVIMVAVDAKDQDIISTTNSEEDGDILENGYRCPTFCPPTSPLNS
jgi:hypothetical protein